MYTYPNPYLLYIRSYILVCVCMSVDSVPPHPFTVLASITQSSVYGAAGLFASGKYTAAVMSGQALAGLFASIARIISIVAAYQTRTYACDIVEAHCYVVDH